MEIASIQFIKGKYLMGYVFLAILEALASLLFSPRSSPRGHPSAA